MSTFESMAAALDRPAGGRWAPVPRWAVASTLLVSVAVTACYLLVDLPFANWFQHLPDETRRPVKRSVKWITELGESGIYLAALLPTVAVLWGLNHRLWAAKLGLIAASIGAAGIAVNLMKVLFGRSRPGAYFEAGAWGFDPFSIGYDFNSFPSGHAAVVGAIAMALVFIAPRLWPLFAAYAVTIGFTRVLTESHYISDVIAGLFLGAIVAVAFRRLWWKIDLWRNRGDLVL